MYSDLTKSQIEDALLKLTQLMKVEEKENNSEEQLENEDELLRSIKELAEEVQNIDVREELLFPKAKTEDHDTDKKLTHDQFNQIIGRIYDKHHL